MKLLIFGLLFFSQVLARSTQTSETATLLLRGRVPASTRLEWIKDDKNTLPKFISNGSKIVPKIIITNKQEITRITIIHP